MTDDVDKPGEPAPEAPPKARPRRRRRRFFNPIGWLFPSREGGLHGFFVGFVLALVPGVAGTLWAISYLADNVSTLINIALGAILVVSLFGTLLVTMQGRLFRRMGLSVRARLGDVALPIHDAVRGVIDGDLEATSLGIRLATEKWAAWYAWFGTRRWVVGIMIALLAGFAALIGSALLHEQNRLIEQQNEYFRRQNAKIEEQIRLAEQQSVTFRRSQLISTLYDQQTCDDPPCAYIASTRSRAEAFRALVALDRRYAAGDPAGASFGLPTAAATDYSGLDLRSANLAGLDLAGADLRDGDLRGASLAGADLSGADLRSARLSAANLRGADLRDARLARADLARANLQGAHLDNGVLSAARLDGARYDEDTTLPITVDRETTQLVAHPTPIECAPCCAAYSAGRAAARAHAAGKATPSELRDLDAELEALGVDGRGDRRTSRLGDRRAGVWALFENDPDAEALWQRTRDLAGAVWVIDREAADAFDLGLYLAYMEISPQNARRFALVEIQRLLPALVSGPVSADTAVYAERVAKGAAAANFSALLADYADAIGHTLGCAAPGP